MGNQLEPSRTNGRGRFSIHSDPLDMYTRLRTSRHARRQAGDDRTKNVLFITSKNNRQRTWGVCVAESAMAPPSPIPNLVVPHGSAGEYCTGNRVGGEAAAHTPQLRCLLYFLQGTVPSPPRGGAVAARWAHNPKVVGSNPAPATRSPGSEISDPGFCFVLKAARFRHLPIRMASPATS